MKKVFVGLLSFVLVSVFISSTALAGGINQASGVNIPHIPYVFINEAESTSALPRNVMPVTIIRGTNLILDSNFASTFLMYTVTFDAQRSQLITVDRATVSDWVLRGDIIGVDGVTVRSAAANGGRTVRFTVGAMLRQNSTGQWVSRSAVFDHNF